MIKRLSKVLLFLFTLSLMFFLYSCYDDGRPEPYNRHHRRGDTGAHRGHLRGDGSSGLDRSR